MAQKRKRVVADVTLPADNDLSVEVTLPSKNKKTRSKRSHGKVVDGYGFDDTPKAFARLMHFRSTGHHRSGLDDGSARKSKGSKIDKSSVSELEIPTILPGERLSDFGARVNQALPIAGLSRKGKKFEYLKPRQSRIEKKIQKKIAVWKREEASRIEKEQDAQDEAEEQEAGEWANGGLPLNFDSTRKGKKRHSNSDVEDPWAVLKLHRDAPKGLHDVVQQPPHLKIPTKQAFKMMEGAAVSVLDIPTSAGSLRRREALTETRNDIIESYRQLMKDKRNAV